MPKHNGTMTCLLGQSGPWEFQVITPRHGLLLCGSEWKRVGAGGSQWKLWKSLESSGRHVGDREGVGRGLGGLEEVWKAMGKCRRGGKAREVTVHYSDPLSLFSSSCGGVLESPSIAG